MQGKTEKAETVVSTVRTFPWSTKTAATPASSSTVCVVELEADAQSPRVPVPPTSDNDTLNSTHTNTITH